MKVNEVSMKYSTKFKVNATDSLDARVQNRILKYKNASSWYSGNLKFYMKVNNHEPQYCTKFHVNASSILDARIKNKVF